MCLLLATPAATAVATQLLLSLPCFSGAASSSSSPLLSFLQVTNRSSEPAPMETREKTIHSHKSTQNPPPPHSHFSSKEQSGLSGTLSVEIWHARPVPPRCSSGLTLTNKPGTWVGMRPKEALYPPTALLLFLSPSINSLYSLTRP